MSDGAGQERPDQLAISAALDQGWAGLADWVAQLTSAEVAQLWAILNTTDAEKIKATIAGASPQWTRMIANLAKVALMEAAYRHDARKLEEA
jgi:hypothetical protein